jgi:hypothetical protein
VSKPRADQVLIEGMNPIPKGISSSHSDDCNRSPDDAFRTDNNHTLKK